MVILNSIKLTIKINHHNSTLCQFDNGTYCFEAITFHLDPIGPLPSHNAKSTYPTWKSSRISQFWHDLQVQSQSLSWKSSQCVNWVPAKSKTKINKLHVCLCVLNEKYHIALCIWTCSAHGAVWQGLGYAVLLEKACSSWVWTLRVHIASPTSSWLSLDFFFFGWRCDYPAFCYSHHACLLPCFPAVMDSYLSGTL